MSVQSPADSPAAVVPDAELLPTAEDLEAMLLETWESYLSGQEAAVPWPAAPGDDDTVDWSASVSFEGPWRGLVALEMQKATAEAATRELLDFEGDDPVEDEDVADAVGELVNILGGAVKSMVAATSTLTLPVVAAGRVAIPRTSTRLCDVALRWQGRVVRMHLHAMAAGASLSDKA